MPTDFRLTSEHWKLLQGIFYEALQLPADERAAFLDHTCEDAAVRTEVEALLDAHEEPAAIFEQSPESLAAELDAATESHVGREIGPYHILRELGRGGMGTVYLARRTDIDHEVALKVVRDMLASPERIRRFLLERRVLARLNHPGIARILDAGMTGDGAPYFVMEYVEGLPITEYCDQHGLGVTERLKLFHDVCAAVQDAHRKLIVHRDLKASNILVTTDGAVKLLDFGIAKVLEDTTDEVLLTQSGIGMMTPAYAAPEQVRGDDVTTATDVYALGLLLYELLAGRSPYDVTGKTHLEICEAVLRTEPRKPSTVAAKSDDIAGLRRLVPGRIHRRLRGDLDTICLTALQKIPERRYASAGELLAEVDRHVKGLPIVARPDNVGYRLGKFASRHRRAVAASVVVLTAFFALAVFYTIQLTEQRNQAQAEAEKANQVSDILIGLFEASDPFAADSDSLDIRTLLQRGVGRAEDLSGQPQLQAEVFDVLGQVYGRLSEYDVAEPLLQRALALRRGDEESYELDVAHSLLNLGVLLGDTGEYDSAEVHLRESLALLERHRPSNHPDRANTLDKLGVVLNRKGAYQEAESLYRQALSIQRGVYDEPHRNLGSTLNNLAVNLFDQGKYEEAERHFREALDVDRAVFGSEHPSTAVGLANLGVLLETQGKYAAADTALTEVLRIKRQTLGDDHYETAFTLTQLGGMLRRKGDYDRAERHLREALEIEGRVLGPSHRNTAVTLNHLALTLQERGDFDAAEPLLRRSATLFSENVGDRHPYTAIVRCHLAYLLHLKGADDASEPLFREALASLEATLPDDHDMLAINRSKFGSMLTAQSRFTEAEPLLVASYRTLNVRFGPGHPDSRRAAQHLVELYDSWDRSDEADSYRRILEAAVIDPE